MTIKQSAKLEGDRVEKLERAVSKLSEELEQQKTITQAVTGENLKIRREFKARVAELNEKIAAARLMGEQVAKIGEGVKKWQEIISKKLVKLTNVFYCLISINLEEIGFPVAF